MKGHFVTTQLFMNIPIFYFYHYIPASICTLINLDKAYCNVLIFFIPRKIFSKYHIPRGRKGEGRKTEVEKEERQRERDRKTEAMIMTWRPTNWDWDGEREGLVLKKKKNRISGFSMNKWQKRYIITVICVLRIMLMVQLNWDGHMVCLLKDCRGCCLTLYDKLPQA